MWAGVFFKFNERTEKIFRMDKRDALAMHIVLRFAVTQHLRAFAREIGAQSIYTFHADTQMMNAALGIALEKFGNRRIGTRRLHQLDLCITEIDIRHAYALLFIDFDLADAKAVDVGEALGCRVEAGDDY